MAHDVTCHKCRLRYEDQDNVPHRTAVRSLRCWGCLYLTALAIIQAATLLVVLSAGPISWLTSTSELNADVPVPRRGAGHGNYCVIDNEEFFLGRDLAPLGVRGYRGLEAWCHTRGGTIHFRP